MPRTRHALPLLPGPARGRVGLAVLRLLLWEARRGTAGRRVAMLLAGSTVTARRHKVHWNGRDARGTQATEGLNSFNWSRWGISSPGG
jgi:hypothetical protein